MKQFNLEIAAPDGVVFSGAAESLLIKCEEGDVEILAGHTDYFAVVGIGRARIKADGASRIGSVSGGMLSVSNGEVKVAVHSFEYSDEIDVGRAKAAKEKAEEMIKNATDDKALAAAKIRLLKAINRINVAEL